MENNYKITITEMKVCPSNHMICMPQCAGYVQGNVQHRFLLFHFYFSISRRIELEYYQFVLLEKNRVFQRDRRFAGSQRQDFFIYRVIGYTSTRVRIKLTIVEVIVINRL